MRRREFIALIASASAAWPLTAFGKARRIAIVASFPVSIMTETSGDPLFQALLNELRRLGYIEGNNLLIERYSGEERITYYGDLVREVTARNPDLVIAMITSSPISKRRQPQFRSLEFSPFRSRPELYRTWRARAAMSPGSLLMSGTISGASGFKC